MSFPGSSQRSGPPSRCARYIRCCAQSRPSPCHQHSSSHPPTTVPQAPVWWCVMILPRAVAVLYPTTGAGAGARRRRRRRIARRGRHRRSLTWITRSRSSTRSWPSPDHTKSSLSFSGKCRRELTDRPDCPLSSTIATAAVLLHRSAIDHNLPERDRIGVAQFTNEHRRRTMGR